MAKVNEECYATKYPPRRFYEHFRGFVARAHSAKNSRKKSRKKEKNAAMPANSFENNVVIVHRVVETKKM